MNVCVVALGKIGLPLAVQYASRGHEVIGADIDPRVVASVNAGLPHFPGEAGLAEGLRSAIAEHQLEATTDTTAAVARSDVVVVVVPLLVDDRFLPDFTAIDAATRAIAAGLRPGTLVLFETTLPVGTTRERFTAALAAGSRLTAGTDFFVAFSPERVSSGRIFADLRRYPKIVGGVDDESTRRAAAFYESALEFDERTDLGRPNGVWDVGSAEAAEFVKLAETTYRDVNIGLANEFARYADRLGVDVYQVIDAANSQPYSHIHRPGIAVGGHCIPVYPRLYLSTDPDATLPLASRRANERMPAYAVDRLEELMGDLAERKVVVLGLAYRGGVKETAVSGVFPVVAELRRRHALALVHDPMYTEDEIRSFGFDVYRLGDPCDGAIVQTDHDEYRMLAPADLLGVRALVDGRGITSAAPWDSAGVPRALIGRRSQAALVGGEER